MNEFMDAPNQKDEDDLNVIPAIDAEAIGSTRVILNSPRKGHSRPSATELSEVTRCEEKV